MQQAVRLQFRGGEVRAGQYELKRSGAGSPGRNDSRRMTFPVSLEALAEKLSL
jgi:hypothetical protein